MTQIVMQTYELSKKYGEFTALDSVSLTLREGDIYGLIGRNGAGKTTFFKCVMGLARPSAGKIIMGSEKNDLNKARQQIGFMINPAFFPYLNPYDSLRYLCRVKGVRDNGEVERLLKLVGLDGIKKPFKKFSLGMKHRLGIAGALLGSPPIVVLDEPVNGLDPQGIIDVREMIKEIHSQTGTTFIISSHILSELDLLATQFGFIEQGNLLMEISHTELHEQCKKSLIIEVDDIKKADTALKTLDCHDISISENNTENGSLITISSHLDKTNEIARALVGSGVELYSLHKNETTLEEYFVRLVGGQDV